jgi:uncharacterized membrane protein YhiD involved in acid resistance
MDATAIVTAIVTTTITAIATTFVAFSNIYLNSQRKKDKEEARKIAERNAAKNSIQNMITQDIIRVEILGKMPENRDNIEDEYVIYHSSGGNGTMTRQYVEYIDWYNEQEKKLTKIK